MAPAASAGTVPSIGVSPERAAAAREIAAVLTPGLRVALTTHVNSDGDGVGSEVALWHLLTAQGLDPVITNPTPIPDRFQFMIPAGADRSDRAAKEIAAARAVVVMDISDLSRLGDLGPAVAAGGGPTVCIDHHVSPGSLPAGRPSAREADLSTVVFQVVWVGAKPGFEFLGRHVNAVDNDIWRLGHAVVDHVLDREVKVGKTGVDHGC